MNSRTLLLGGILVVLVFITGFGIAHFSASPTTVIQNTGGTGQTQTPGTTAAASTTTGIVVKPSSLTDGQKKMLSVMGIDPNNIVLTPKMIACADASLGTDRIKALEGGATPSFTEGIKLAACYR
jgi:hypothetical protein